MGRSAATSIIVAGLVCGCAGLSAQRPRAVPADALYDRHIVVVRQPAPPLQADALGHETGEALTSTYRLADPAAGIGRGLAIRLATERGMIVLSTGAEAAAVAEASALAAAHPGADYVLDVQTLAWALDDSFGARGRYRLDYAARLRLIDAQGEVVAATRCRSEQGDVDNPPSREDLLAQQAALMKGYLDLATARCIEHAASTMLGLRASEPRPARARGEPIRVPQARAAAPVQIPPAAAPMPSVHDFFDDGEDRRAAAAPATPTPMPIVMPPTAARALPAPTPAAPAVAAQPRPVAVPAPTPTPTPIPTPTPGPTPGVEPAPPVPAAAARAPASTPSDADDALRSDRLTPAARASGQVIELLDDTPFRDSPRLTTRISRTLPAGTEVVVRQRVYNAEGEWWFIIIPGDIGWIRSPDPVPYGSRRAGPP